MNKRNQVEVSNQSDALLEQSPPTKGEIVSKNSSPSNIAIEGPVNGDASDFQENDFSGLETPLECRLRKKSHFVVYTTTFIMSIGFSIVLTGVYPYLKQLDQNASKEFLGWVIAANPLGQMLASPLLGWWSNSTGSFRGAFLSTVTVYILGNALYGLLPLFSSSAKYVMIVSRFIVGLSSANVAICRSYIAASTRMEERTSAIAITSAAQAMAFIIGPGIQAMLAYMFHGSSHEQHRTSNFTGNISEDAFNNSTQYEESQNEMFNMYTLTGWCGAGLGFINLCLYLPCVFKEFKIGEEEAKYNSVVLDVNLDDCHPDFVALFLVLFTFFVTLFMFVLLETLIVPMCLDMYAWTPEFAVEAISTSLIICGIVTFFMFVLSGKLAKVIGDRKTLLIFGLVPLTISMVLFFPLGNTYPKIKYCLGPNDLQTMNSTVSSLFKNQNFTNGSSVSNNTEFHCKELGCPAEQIWCLYTPIIEIPQLIIASIFLVIGYPVSIAICSSLFSKILVPKSQGLWMGVQTSIGSLARIIGPILVSYLYTSKGPLWTFVSLFLILFIAFVLNCILYKRLIPFSFKSRKSVDLNDVD